MKPKNKIKLFEKTVKKAFKLLEEIGKDNFKQTFERLDEQRKKEFPFHFSVAPIEEKNPKIEVRDRESIHQSSLNNGSVCNNLQDDFIYIADTININDGSFIKREYFDKEPFAVAPIETKLPMFDYDVLFDKTKTPIAPPLGSNHNFHKQAVEAEKELDKVCKESKKHVNIIITAEWISKIDKMIEACEFIENNESLLKEIGFEITIKKQNQDSN